MTRSRQEAAALRAERAGNYGRPAERRWHEMPGSAPVARIPLTSCQFRAADGDANRVNFTGYASVTETGYEMWDWAGPYTEIVERGAFGVTLAKAPDVAFLLNHGGMTLARTKSGTLSLAEDETGLVTEAGLDARMSTVRDIQLAMERGDLDEMSFAFIITRGQWSPDYMEFRIKEVDLERGDVSVVNYGANPSTSAALRSHDLLSAITTLSDDDLAKAQERIATRLQRFTAPASPAVDELGALQTLHAARRHAHRSQLSGH